jgi:hypothetical protein
MGQWLPAGKMKGLFPEARNTKSPRFARLFPDLWHRFRTASWRTQAFIVAGACGCLLMVDILFSVAFKTEGIPDQPNDHLANRVANDNAAEVEKLRREARAAEERAKAAGDKAAEEKRKAEIERLQQEAKAAAEKLKAAEAKDAEKKVNAEIEKLRKEARAAEERAKAAEARTAEEKLKAERLRQEKEAAEALLAQQSKKPADPPPTRKTSFKIPTDLYVTPLGERIDLDPAVQGVWHAVASSKDRGKTIDYKDGSAFAHVSATRVKMVGYPDFIVEKVIICKDFEGNLGDIVRFTNGVVWTISKKPGQPYVLVQEFDARGEEESVRVVITVDR